MTRQCTRVAFGAPPDKEQDPSQATQLVPQDDATQCNALEATTTKKLYRDLLKSPSEAVGFAARLG
jgi:hypothetical protein